MIKWCAYCQQFQGEFPPFEKKDLSHGICPECQTIGLDWTDAEEEKIRSLSELNKRFWSAGRDGDPNEMKKLAKEGLNLGIRPIDMLFGFAGPHLVHIGSLWEAGELTHEEENIFTSTVRALVTLIAESTPQPEAHHRILLANVFENTHFLGLRFTSLGLAQGGVGSIVLGQPTAAREVLEAAIAGQCDTIGLSVSMNSQEESLRTTLDILTEGFSGNILVGGGAINSGLILPNQPKNVHFVCRPRFHQSEVPKLLGVSKLSSAS